MRMFQHKLSSSNCLPAAALAISLFVVAAVAPVAAPSPALSSGAAKRCHRVVKKIHGVRKSVRVCPKSKPANLPPAAPPLTVLKRNSLDAPGYVFVAPKTGASRPQGPEIVDDHGRPVWFHPTSNGQQTTDFRVQTYLGKPVLTWWQGEAFPGGGGVDYIADTAYHVIATVRAGNGLDAGGHEFVLTPQGTALIVSYHDVPYDLSSLGGPKDGQVLDGVVQEIDVATGRLVFEWHSLDRVPLTDSYVSASTANNSDYDYFHINAVNLDNDGNLLISGRHTSTVYKVDRHSGQIIWRLGGKHSDFTLGPGLNFAWQHDPLPAGENTIRLFDNGTDGSAQVSPESRVLWIHLDTATMTATLVKAISHPARLSVRSQGNAQGLDNGDTFVGWGQLGRVSEFDPEGKLLFDAALPPAYDTYRAYRSAWSGQPDTMPTAIARLNANGTTTVHAIWNGATQVATWRILAGPSPRALSPVRTAHWNGLDTVLKIRGMPQEVEVVALDAHGGVIRTSRPVAADRVKA
jgi:hypothetical protein